MENETTTSELLKLLAPFLAGTAVVTVAVLLLLLRLTPLGALAAAPSVVSFDVVKYTNSQRAVASSFLKQGSDVSKASELLLNLPERTRQAIAEVAGPRTLVVLKQAVVQGQTADITDAVLTKLSMPINVPTADAASYSLDSAPTMLIAPSGAKPLITPAPASSASVLP